MNTLYLCCRLIAGLPRYLLNPASLRPVPIQEEPEDQAAETDTGCTSKSVATSSMILMHQTRRGSEKATNKHGYPFPSIIMSQGLIE
jgi:hypothetical protein